MAKGDYGVVKTSSFVGWLIRVGTVSRWNHTFIDLGDGTIVEALGSGVQISPVSKYPKIAWNKHEVLTDSQREAIVGAAKGIVGEPYGFFDIINLGLRILGLKVLTNGILDRLARRNGIICSELVAECYAKAGIDFGKPPYLETPGDLAERLVWL